MMRFSGKQNRDWVAFWYAVARERGQNHISSLGRGEITDLVTGDVRHLEYHDFTHIDDDGIGAVNRTLAKLGSRTRNWPLAKDPKTYSLIDTTRAVYHALKVTSGRKAVWKRFEPGPPGDVHDYHSVAMSVEETTDLRSYCAEMKISLNVFLALEVDRLSREWLADPEQETKWLFPVNMRGLLGPDLERPNQVSYVPFLMKPSMSPSNLRSQIRSHFEMGVPWGNWHIYNVGRFVGERGVRCLSLRASQKSFWMGTISDMGAWSTDEEYQRISDKEVWFAAPPGSPNYPIGVTHITFNGRLCLSLKVHPSIHTSQGWPQKALKEIRTNILDLAKSR